MSKFFDEMRAAIRDLAQEQVQSLGSDLGYYMYGVDACEKNLKTDFGAQIHLLRGVFANVPGEPFLTPTGSLNLRDDQGFPLHTAELVVDRIQEHLEKGWQPSPDGSEMVLMPKIGLAFEPAILMLAFAGKGIVGSPVFDRDSSGEQSIGIKFAEPVLRRLEEALDISIDRGQGRGR